jgi:hypothetical protein
VFDEFSLPSRCENVFAAGMIGRSPLRLALFVTISHLQWLASSEEETKIIRILLSLMYVTHHIVAIFVVRQRFDLIELWIQGDDDDAGIFWRVNTAQIFATLQQQVIQSSVAELKNITKISIFTDSHSLDMYVTP